MMSEGYLLSDSRGTRASITHLSQRCRRLRHPNRCCRSRLRALPPSYLPPPSTHLHSRWTAGMLTGFPTSSPKSLHTLLIQMAASPPPAPATSKQVAPFWHAAHPLMPHLPGCKHSKLMAVGCGCAAGQAHISDSRSDRGGWQLFMRAYAAGAQEY